MLDFPRYLDRQKSTFEFKHDEPQLMKKKLTNLIIITILEEIWNRL